MRIVTWLGAGLMLLLCGNPVFSQQLKLGSNPYTIQKSALLELNSTNQGLLLARITDTTLINSLTPPDGMVIFFTPTKQLMVRSNGSWQAFTPAGTAISSLNGLTAATQTFATGTAGTDFGISSSGSVHTFNIPDASATARGLISTGTQTLAGTKTFSSAPVFSSLTAGSIPYIGTGGVLSQNNAKLFWDATNSRLGVGTNAPGSDLTLYQSTGGTSKGFRLTGNSIGGTSAGTGFTMALGYNLAGNKQLWLGDVDYMGNSAGTFVRYSTSGGQTILDAVAGDNSVRRSTRIGVGNDPLSSVILGDDGNTATPGSYVWDSNNMAIGSGYRSASAPTNGLLVQGNVGIGTTAPSTALHVVGTNPLTLMGVQAGTSTSADSLLTITNGLVRKIPASTFTPAGNFWALGGNTVGSVKNFGTVDAFDLPFVTSNTEKMRLSTTGNLGIGSSTFNATNPEKLLVQAGTTTSFNLMQGHGKINNYLQLNIQNDSAGTSASSDVVATSDNGNETSNYIDLGINSSANASTGTVGGANNAYLYSTGNDFSIGNATANKNLLFFTGGTASSNEAMRIDGSGKVGIGTTSPSTALHVVGTNPLTLMGVQAGTSTSADSLLTITNGLVRKIPTSTYTTAANFWALGGNTVGSLKNFGTVDAFDLPFITGNTEKMRLSNTGNLGIGSTSFNASNPEKLLVQAGTTTSFNLMQGHGKINNYLQLNIQNDSAGTSASSDLVATSDNGNESTNYIDLGINSSVNSSTGTIGGANNAYLYSTGNDFSIGNATANKNLLFFTGGTASSNEAMRINGSGRVGIGTTAPATVLHVSGTNPLTLTGVQTGTSTSADSLLTITSGLVRKIPMTTFSSASNFWAMGGNTVGTAKNFGTLDNNVLPFITNSTERMRISAAGDVGIGVTDPSNNLVVKDTLEIRRTGTLSELLFSNTAGTGDFRIGGDGGDIFWQGGGGRNLQMGAYWTILLAGDRQLGTFPSYVNGTGNTGVLVQAQRDASVPLAIQANSATQSANFTEWRSSTGSVLNAVDKNGNLGLGTSTPSSKLHVVGTNPLTLTGVQTGTSTSADSLLTITSGLVRKIPMSTFSTSSNYWAQGGNTVGAVKSIGTIDNFDLSFITNNTEQMRLSSSGNLSIGSATFNATNPEQLLVQAGTTSSYNLMQGHGKINNYLQINVQNDSAGVSASSDLVATSDNGNETSNYVDLGINSSVNASAGVIGGANNAYLYSTGKDFAIGNGSSGRNLLFFTGGTGSNERMRIDGNGKVGIATTSPSAQLDVAGNFKLGASGSVLTNMFKTSVSVTDNTNGISYTQSLSKTITVTGAVANATVMVNPRSALPNGVAIAYAYVSSANTVTINFTNSGAGVGGTQNLGTVTFDITIIQ